jgi:hypothetical protein
MADCFDVVAVRIEDEGPIVARMVLGAKPGTAVVVPARRDGCLMEGINSGAVICSKRDVEGLARPGRSRSQACPTVRTPLQRRWVP